MKKLTDHIDDKNYYQSLRNQFADETTTVENESITSTKRNKNNNKNEEIISSARPVISVHTVKSKSSSNTNHNSTQSVSYLEGMNEKKRREHIKGGRKNRKTDKPKSLSACMMKRSIKRNKHCTKQPKSLKQ